MTAQIPHGPEDKDCPFHKKAMAKVCHKCPLWVLVRGKNPQNDADVDRWDCSFAWMPMLMIETANIQRQHRSSTDSMRNEIVKRMDNPATLPQPKPQGQIGSA